MNHLIEKDNCPFIGGSERCEGYHKGIRVAEKWFAPFFIFGIVSGIIIAKYILG